MERISLQIARTGERVLHEPGAVEGADGVGVGDSRRNHLAPARIAGHEMGFDQTGGDLEIGLEKKTVEFDRRAARRVRPRSTTVGVVSRKMIFDADGGEHPRIADQLGQFGAFVGTMQAGGDQDANACPRECRPRAGPRSSGGEKDGSAPGA